MAWFKLPADADDFPADSPERNQAGLAAAGALCNQSHIISDWGDCAGDYGPDEHEAACRSIGSGPSERSDVHCSTIEETNAFYDSCRAQGIRIRPQN